MVVQNGSSKMPIIRWRCRSIVGLLLNFLALLHLCSCAHSTAASTATPHPATSSSTDTTNTAPTWVNGDGIDSNKLCGLGVAGPGFNTSSPYPQQLSQARAVRNLAGILATRVEEAIIDSESESTQITRATSSSANSTTTNALYHSQPPDIELAKYVSVDEALIERVSQIATYDTWLDTEGIGPFAQKKFTYARACMEANVAAAQLGIDSTLLENHPTHDVSTANTLSGSLLPRWFARTGVQPGGRICAVGFSMSTFFPDAMFENVAQDIRSQLAQVLETFVSTYTEDHTNNDVQTASAMTLATTQALAKGVWVTHYWYDHDGIGPAKQPNTTYGWGCMPIAKTK